MPKENKRFDVARNLPPEKRSALFGLVFHYLTESPELDQGLDKSPYDVREAFNNVLQTSDGQRRSRSEVASEYVGFLSSIVDEADKRFSTWIEHLKKNPPKP